MTLQAPSMFRTPAGQARYFAAYDATLALWPVPVEAREVPTRYGPTHVLVSGRAAAPPLVLLPGQAVSATMWYPNVAALSRDYRVYAVDIIGDMGKSVRTQARMAAPDFAVWLGEVLDGLGLAQAHIAGLSYGGFLALNLAVSAPQRVRRLVLMAPASLLPLHPLFFARMACVFLPGFVLSAEAKQRVLLGVYAPGATPVIKQMMTTSDFRFNMYLPPVFTDAQLRQVRSPTLLLLGDHEVIYARRAAVKRAQRLIGPLETDLIPGAGHALTLDQPELVNQRVVAFLQADGAA